MMSDTKRSSTDPGGIEAPRAPVTGADAKRSFDTLVPTPEPEQVAPDMPHGGRQVDTGESYKRLEDRDARRKRSQMLGMILAFAVVFGIGIVAIKMMTGPKEVQPAPPATVTVTVPVITTITVPVMTTATAVPTVTTPVTATTSARPLASVKPSATATATATPTASTTPSAKPSASHDPDYIRDFHP